MFKTYYSGHVSENARSVERNRNLPSRTVPNEAMSVREILTRFANGLSVQQGHVPLYDTDGAGVLDESRPLNWDSMDFAERINFIEEHQGKLELLKRDLDAAKKKADEEKEAKRIDDLAEKKALEKQKKAAAKDGGKPDGESYLNTEGVRG